MRINWSKLKIKISNWTHERVCVFFIIFLVSYVVGGLLFHSTKYNFPTSIICALLFTFADIIRYALFSPLLLLGYIVEKIFGRRGVLLLESAIIALVYLVLAFLVGYPSLLFLVLLFEDSVSLVFYIIIAVSIIFIKNIFLKLGKIRFIFFYIPLLLATIFVAFAIA